MTANIDKEKIAQLEAEITSLRNESKRILKDGTFTRQKLKR